MLSAARSFRLGAWARSSATSSGLSTTGSRSGDGIRAIRSPKPGRPRVTCEGDVEEKPERRARQVHAGIARAERGQVKLVAPEILGLGPVRRAAQKGRELADLADIISLRVLAELANDHVLDYPSAQRRNDVVAHGGLPSKVRLNLTILRRGSGTLYSTAEPWPPLPRERFSPLAHCRRRPDDRIRGTSRRSASVKGFGRRQAYESRR